MHEFVGVMNWVVGAAGLAAVALGASTLVRQRVAFPWLRSRVAWRPHGWANVLLGAFILVETVPRLIDASAVVVLSCSLLALVPLTTALVLQSRARRDCFTGSG